MWTHLVIVGSVLVLGVAYCMVFVGRRPKGCPPGPPTLPIIGNLHQLAHAQAEPHLQYQKWAQEYGPIYSIVLGTKVQIVLSSDQAIKGLIDTRGAISSSRPEFYMGGELGSGDLRFALWPYGQKWRMQRKLAHYALNAKKIVDYTPYLEVESKQLLFDILHDSTDILSKFRRFSSSMMGSIVFGFRWKRWDNPELQEVFRLLNITSEIFSAGTAPLADFYPLLRRIPACLYPLKRKALALHVSQKALYKSYYMTAKHAIIKKLPTARPCLCTDILTFQQQENLSDDTSTFLANTFFEAGSETTASTLYGFIQAMLLYPAAQRAAQAEVDALCNNDNNANRWPEPSDLPNLPYIRACVKEILRWMPAAPLGIPHALIQDTEYMGYHLPAHASLLLNTYTIHNDPTRYPSPELFLPERHLGDSTSSSESSVLTDVSERDHFGFGSGRRICPGMHIVDRTLAVVVARLVWGFDVKAVVGGDGKVVLPRQGDWGRSGEEEVGGGGAGVG
ncbi:cytochrome P450 [Plenodomus tracheiphilus IPT5]|uniref:Cytochrome P450 n=1 Tax=Plenodomus tracheiphilus IPT5 TaxID=1408161 RepID=A0A6A7AP99_9PLEO|nr:cytochrome P450 [Plenodomus tracheiphilus IPT5]